MRLKLLHAQLHLVLLITVSSPSDAKNNRQSVQVLNMTIDAMHRIVEFFYRVKRDINLDALIASRIAEGQLYKLLQKLEPVVVPNALGKSISSMAALQREMERFANEANVYVEDLESDYYSTMKPLVLPGAFRTWYKSRDLNMKRVEYPLRSEAFDEDFSDFCFCNILGTSADKNSPPSKPCTIPPVCKDVLTTPGYGSYSLAHQILYLQLIREFKCSKAAEDLGDVPKLLNDFCGSVFLEAIEIQNDNFQPSMRDLFMEQVALCGYAGFRDFFHRPSWLYNILSWQRKSGCYGQPKDLEEPESTVRVKREEKMLEGGCLSHKSGVALVALGEFLRYTIEDTI